MTQQIGIQSLQDSERLDPCNETARPVRRLFRRSARGGRRAAQERGAADTKCCGNSGDHRIPHSSNRIAAEHPRGHSQPLKNARSDAKAIAAELKTVGFDVTLKQDLTQKMMKTALREFKSQVAGGSFK
jgi:ketopantoate reductase